MAEPIALNETIRRHREDPESTDRLRLRVPSAGVLLLHVSSPASAGTSPHLRFLGRGCAGVRGNGGGYVVLRESPAGLLLRISKAGSLFFTVSPEDPSRPLSYFKLQTAFAAEPRGVDEVIALAGDPPASCAAEGLPSFASEPLGKTCLVELRRDALWTKDVDPIDCDVVTGGVTAPGVLVVESAEPLGAALYAGTDCDPEDRQAEGVLGSPGAFVAAPVHAGDYRLDLQLFRPAPPIQLAQLTVGGPQIAVDDCQLVEESARLALVLFQQTPRVVAPVPRLLQASGFHEESGEIRVDHREVRRVEVGLFLVQGEQERQRFVQ
ncbi:MAG TPA: hypothetical protein VGG06_02190 [Thermoanaerobaculia bacterium]